MSQIATENNIVVPKGNVKVTSSLRERCGGAITRFLQRILLTTDNVEQNYIYPVSYDRCSREVRNLQATQNFSVGAKFDFQSVISPRLTTAHSFSWGSDQQLPSYFFSTVYSGKKFFVNGMVDNEGSLQFQGDYNWFQKKRDFNENSKDSSQNLVGGSVPPDTSQQHSPAALLQSYVGTATHLRAHIHKIPSKSVAQLEQELYGKNFVLTLKASSHNMLQSMQPLKTPSDIFSLNGSYFASIMHKVTNSLFLGAEFSHQRLGPDMHENIVSYAFRYANYPKLPYPQPHGFPPSIPSPFPPISPKDPEYSIVGMYTPSTGTIYSCFYQRLSQRLEAFAELSFPTIKPPERAPPQSYSSSLSVGFKLDTLHSTIRSMVDSNYTVTTTIEERLFPGFSVLISTRLGYGKENTQGQVGLSFALES